MSPSRELIQCGPYTLAGRCDMATQCGGDWWSYRALSGDRLLVVIGDVTGHGVSAAMVAATARGALEAMRTVDDTQITPVRVLEAMDDAVRSVGEQFLLMTCFAAILDAPRNSIEFANAGHCFPYVTRANAEGRLGDLSVLALRGNPLGSAERSFSTWRRAVAHGEMLLLATDGVVDRINVNGDRFSDKRYRALLSQSRFDATSSAQSLRDHVVDKIEAFAGGCPSDDDVTLIVCHYNQPHVADEPRSIMAAG